MRTLIAAALLLALGTSSLAQGTEIRVYVVVTAPAEATPTAEQWEALYSALVAQYAAELAEAVQYAGGVSTSKIAQGDPGRALLVAWEIPAVLVAQSTAWLDQTALALGIMETDEVSRIAALIQALPAVALANSPELFAGWASPEVFVSGVTVEVIGYGTRDRAIADGMAYLADHAAIWYAPIQD